MASLTESEAVFSERAKTAGLPAAHLTRLSNQHLNTLSRLAFAAGQPGETPSDAKLTELGAIPPSTTVPVLVLAAMRRIVFETQTLMVPQVRSLMQGQDEHRAELAGPERSERIKAQAARLTGHKGLTRAWNRSVGRLTAFRSISES